MRNSSVRAKLSAAGAVLMSLLLMIQMAPHATAAVVNTIEQSWTLPGEPTPNSSIANGAPSPVYVWVASNDTAGAGGTQHNVTFITTVTNGTITRVPSECSGSGSGISALPHNNDPALRITSTLTCNVGSMRHGTAKRVAVPVVAHGFDTNQLTVASRVGSVNTTNLTKRISASVGGDIRMDHNSNVRTVERTSRNQILVPVSINVPVGAEGLAPTGSFVLTLGNWTRNADLVPTGCNAAGVAADPSWPAAQPQDRNINCTFSAYGSGGNQWNVVFTGFNTDPAKAQTRSNTNAALPASRVHLATFNVILNNRQDLFDANSTFEFFARADSATLVTARGQSVADNPLTNNRTNFSFVMGGSRAAAWSRNSPSRMAFDGRNIGTEWDNSPRVLPGETWLPYVVDSTNSGTRAGYGQDMSMCLVLQSTHYSRHDNYIYFNSPTGNSAGADVTIEFSSDPVYNTTVGSAHCDEPGVTWTTARFAPQGSQASRIGDELNATLPMGGTWNQWALNHLRWIHGSTPDAEGPVPTRVRMTYRGAAVNDTNVYSEVDNHSFLAMPVKIRSSAPGTRAWMAGATKRATDSAYYVSNNAPVVNTIGGSVPTTITSMRDVLTVADWRVTLQQQVNHPVAQAGEDITFTVTIGAESQSQGTRVADVSNLLPSGFTFVTGSGTGITPTVSTSSGRQLLRWDNVSLPNNGTRAVTFKARSSSTGTFTNTVQAVKDGESSSSIIQGSVVEASTTVAVQDTGATVLAKAPAGATLTAGDSNQWNVTVTNDDSKTQTVTDVIDILPYPGDRGGSSFSGSYTVGDVTTSRGSVFYTTRPPGTINPDPAHSTNGALGVPSSMWTSTKPAADQITAVRFVASGLTPGQVLRATIGFSPNGAQVGDSYVNWAHARSTFTALSMVRSAATTVVAGGPIVQVDKFLLPEQNLQVGSQVRYGVRVHNGTGSARRVEVRDVPEQNLSNAQFAGTTSPTWVIPSLGAGETTYTTVEATVGGEGTDLVNRVFVVGFGDSCTRSNVQVNIGYESDTDACDMVTTELDTVLKVDKQVMSKAMRPGGRVEFNVTARNDGPANATSVVVTDTAMAGLTDVEFVQVGKGSSSGAVWTVGALNAGEQVTGRVTGRVAADANFEAGVVNAASIAAAGSPRGVPTGPADCVANSDGINSDTDQCDVVTVTEDSVLQVDKEVLTKAALSAGERVEFTITARNSGPETAEGVVVTDTSLDGFTDVEFTGVAPRGSFDGDRWLLGVLGAGQSVTATVTATINGSSLSNAVSIANPSNPRAVPNGRDECSPNADGVASDDDQCDRVEVTETSLLRIDKGAADVTGLVPGSDVSWTITIFNDGPDYASQVRVTDVPVDGVTDAVFTSVGQGSAAPGGVWLVGDLAPGVPVTATVTGKVADNVDRAVGLINMVVVSNPVNPKQVPASPVGCTANSTVEADDDQCDVTVTELGGLTVTVLFDADGTGECVEDGSCAAMSHTRVVIDAADHVTNTAGVSAGGPYRLGDSAVVELPVPVWARLSDTMVDGVVMDEAAAVVSVTMPDVQLRHVVFVLRVDEQVPDAPVPVGARFESGI